MRTWEEIREDFPILKEKIHGKVLLNLFISIFSVIYQSVDIKSVEP